MADDLELFICPENMEKLKDALDRIKEVLQNVTEDIREMLSYIAEKWESLLDEQIYDAKEPDYDRIPPRVLPGRAAHRSAFRAPPGAAYRHWRCSVYGKH